MKRRLASLIEGLPQLVWLSADGGRWVWSSPGWTSYTGLTVEASQGLGWYDAIHPQDRGMVEAAWEAAPSRGVLDVEHRLLDLSTGEARWFRTHGAPLPGGPGQDPAQGREWVGTCTDVHQTRWLEERERLLLAELHRRVSNVLGLTRLVARRSLKAGGTAEDRVLHLDGRLDAIARTQALLACDPEGGVDLEQLVRDELLAHAAQEGKQLRVSGPGVVLSGKAAGLFGLAVHELAANAVKYGALSVPDGHIAATWHVAGAGGPLRFEWLETGVPLPEGPARHRGFGTELIGRMLDCELGATAAFDAGRDGVRWTILLPLKAGVAAPVT